MIKKVPIFFLIMVIVSAGLFAEGAESHHFDWGGLIGKVMNSAILFGGLALLFRKQLIDFLSRQSGEIGSALKSSAKELKQKSRELEELKKRLAGLEKEIERMKHEAADKGEEEKRKIKELAGIESERILKNSESEIEARIESAVRSLKSRIADMTIGHFKEEFEKKLDGELHQKIIENNIDIIGELNERG